VISAEEKKFLETIQGAIDFRKKRLKRFDKIRQLSDHEGWEALKADIELSIDANKFALEQYSDTSLDVGKTSGHFMAEVRSHGGALRAYRGIIDNVERATDKVAQINDEIADLEKRAKQISEKAPEAARKHRSVV